MKKLMDKNVLENYEKCNGCGACYHSCPVRAIKMLVDSEGFKYPVINEKLCIQCQKCLQVCPVMRQKTLPDWETQAYACYNKDLALRLRSSSGGVFGALAQYFLQCGGVIFGAAFDASWQVRHIAAVNAVDVAKLYASKYVQSDLHDVFLQAELALKQQKQVLFTGTPCQISGFKAFLGREYDNLFTVDIICHGVPSPFVWQQYLQENFTVEKIKTIKFRDKTEGWKNYNFAVTYADGIVMRQKFADNIYMRGFLSDLYLRPSCYACSFKTMRRSSDRTLADCWGSAQLCSAMDDDKGLSLVFIQSGKGKRLFEALKEDFSYCAVDNNEAAKYNAAMIKSAAPHKNRAKFFKLVVEKNYSINKAVHHSLYSLRKRFSMFLRKK